MENLEEGELVFSDQFKISTMMNELNFDLAWEEGEIMEWKMDKPNFC